MERSLHTDPTEVPPMNTTLSDQEAVDRLIESTEKDIDIQADELLDLVLRTNDTYTQAMIAAYEEGKSKDDLRIMARTWGRILRQVALFSSSPDVLCAVAAPFTDEWQPKVPHGNTMFVTNLWSKALDEADSTAECFLIRDSMTGAEPYLEPFGVKIHSRLCDRCDNVAIEFGERDKPHEDEWVTMYREQFIDPFEEEASIRFEILTDTSKPYTIELADKTDRPIHVELDCFTVLTGEDDTMIFPMDNSNLRFSIDLADGTMNIIPQGYVELSKDDAKTIAKGSADYALDIFEADGTQLEPDADYTFVSNYNITLTMV